jgi:hypothetical protein
MTFLPKPMCGMLLACLLPVSITMAQSVAEKLRLAHVKR